MRWSKGYHENGRKGWWESWVDKRLLLLATTTAAVLLLTFFSSYRWVGRYVDVSRIGSL